MRNTDAIKEYLNAVFINDRMAQPERLSKLNAIAISQIKVLTEDHRMLSLDKAETGDSGDSSIS